MAKWPCTATEMIPTIEMIPATEMRVPILTNMANLA